MHLGAYGLDSPSSSSSSLVPRPRCSAFVPGRVEDEDEGRGRGEGCGLVPLVERLLATPGLRRLRLSSLEVREVSDELVRLAAASPALCPHFHIPLQSGDDGVLHAMNRRYTAADFLRRLDLIRSLIAEPAITTDILVGFPGETDEAFRRTLDVARRAGFSRIHVFPYSERPGTAAAAMPGKLPWPTIKARRDAARALASELMAAYHRRFVGRSVQPLVESQRDPRTGLLCGYTERYVRTLFDGPDQLRGTIVPVRVTAVIPGGLRGQL
ncbi:MAG: radical SAM protein [Planctomycetes bacterium]|nr:radical SAM protein [Planctomycetota bacterium]